jgi:hypothetical protein
MGHGQYITFLEDYILMLHARILKFSAFIESCKIVQDMYNQTK